MKRHMPEYGLSYASSQDVVCKGYHMRVLIIASPIGPLGTGLCGGLDITIPLLAQELIQKGHSPFIVAPKGSTLSGVPFSGIEGNWQETMLKTTGKIEIPENSVLENMCDFARNVQNDYDVILNFAYDWLPFYLTPFFQRPIAHWLTMSSLSRAMDAIIEKTLQGFPDRVAVFSKGQASSFNIPSRQSLKVMGNCIEIGKYHFVHNPEHFLAWMGRISPEKGIEDALAAAQKVKMPLKIMGFIQDQDYWERVSRAYPDADAEYLGFLSTDDMQKTVGKAKAVLVTPKWEEAFANVAMEALACGVPVIAYRRGGLGEVVKHGVTGFIVDDIPGLVSGIQSVDQIDRKSCRKHAEKEFSSGDLADRLIKWLKEIQ